MESLTIGKVGRLAEVGVETVRFYEREGLIDEPPRRESGYRQYPEETVHRLRFIRCAKELGFTLKEIKELLGLRVDVSSTATCDAVRSLAEEKIADVRDKIRTLQRMETVIAKLVCDCRNRAVTGDCPILWSGWASPGLLPHPRVEFRYRRASLSSVRLKPFYSRRH